jgi:tRNA (cytidine56-2'-O)-methyltransferase
MRGTPDVTVLRLGHRPGRDERMTTHVGLTARALGADRIVLSGQGVSRRGAIEDITDRFGGPFAVEGTDDGEDFLEDWEGGIVHLTMYGLEIQAVEQEIRDRFDVGTPLLVVVGAGKVPFEIYERSTWNVAVTNQPHSEVASLAVFLDRLFQGTQLDREWEDADHEVVPQAVGKRVEQRD